MIIIIFTLSSLLLCYVYSIMRCYEHLKRSIILNYYRDFRRAILPVIPPPPMASDSIRPLPAQVQCAQTSVVTFLSRLRKPVAGLSIHSRSFPGCRSVYLFFR